MSSKYYENGFRLKMFTTVWQSCLTCCITVTDIMIKRKQQLKQQSTISSVVISRALLLTGHMIYALSSPDQIQPVLYSSGGVHWEGLAYAGSMSIVNAILRLHSAYKDSSVFLLSS